MNNDGWHELKEAAIFGFFIGLVGGYILAILILGL